MYNNIKYTNNFKHYLKFIILEYGKQILYHMYLSLFYFGFQLKDRLIVLVSFKKTIVEQ